MKVLNYHSQINISSIRCFCMSVFTFNRIYHERGSVDRGNYIDQSIYGQTQIIDVVLHFIISVQSNAFFYCCPSYNAYDALVLRALNISMC